MKFTVEVELQHSSGPEQDVETMLDYFAATIGQQNGAKLPLHLTVEDYENETKSVYFVKLVDVPEPVVTGHYNPTTGEWEGS